MSFTVCQDPAVEARIAADLAAIRDRLLELLGEENVHSLLLTGGFGRGEGSVRVVSGEVKVVNDYDLAVVVPSPTRWQFLRLYRRWHRPVERLSEDLAAQLGMKQVDLALKPLSYFTRPASLKIENYEVKEGHKVLHGEDPCRFMPAWRAKDIPVFEGTWLFRNRGLGLLLARLYLTQNGALADEDRENFFIECNKAQLAMGDALLLLQQQYHYLYTERLKIAQTLSLEGVPRGREIVLGYQEALAWKLRPDDRHRHQPSPQKLWARLASSFCEFFLYFESLRLGQPSASWLDYAGAAKPEDRVNLRTCLGEIIRARSAITRPNQWRRILLKANRSKNVEVIGLLLTASESSPERKPCLQRAAQLLGLPPNGDDDAAWLVSTLTTLRLIHPGGEVGRVLKRFGSKVRK